MKTIFGISADTLEQFEEAAQRSTECGATHLLVTEDLPVAQWQFDSPGDPYPAWYAFQPGLLKTFPPEDIHPYINLDHAKRVGEILEQRCEILRRYNLRGVYHTTEPQVLPEELYLAHPQWRGPRVDQPNRSRTARFAPCVGHPEVLRLYSESVSRLLRRCPEIDTFLFLTIDSGSGFCWAPSLYPGANGCSCCSEADLEDRAVGFLNILADSARQEGTELEIDLVEIEPRSWMRKTFRNPERLATRLPAGLSINHCEGPDGNPFASERFSNLFFNAFYPVVGLPRPLNFLKKLIHTETKGAKRAILSFNDGLNTDLNASLYQAFQKDPARNTREAMQLLHAVAGEIYDPESADTVFDIWSAIDDAEQQLASLDFGPFVLMGGLLARWITRPFVPFPEELGESERGSFFPYLFQARDENSALNLVDIQAMRMFEGWGARLLVEQSVEATFGHLNRARAAAESMGSSYPSESALMIARLYLLTCFLRTGRNAVAYQAQLDRLKAAMAEEEIQPPPPLGASASWDCRDLVNIARAEIDNTAETLEIIKKNGCAAVDMAPEGIPESIMRFSNDLISHLEAKISIMNAKWMDYARLSPPANP
ncbi:MAG: hypothetical protein AB3N64_13315 [Puniceicoccaceae bacterium]